MDKRIILAVAGSGKTTEIVNRLSSIRRSLILTYTTNNLINLRKSLIERHAAIPSHVTVSSYFSFLYSFCFAPFRWRNFKPSGYNWNQPPASTRRFGANDRRYYLDSQRRMYHNRLAKLIEAQKLVEKVRGRLEKYYDVLLIDEAQDFGGHDFNLLCRLAGSEIEILLVGDFHQHTFDTSRDGNVNCALYSDLGRYISRLEAAGLAVDRESLVRSYRCSPSVCSFVKENLGITIDSHREDATRVEWIEKPDDARRIQESSDIVKLFLKEHYRFGCRSNNWGASKGDGYDDVAVVLNPGSLELLRTGRGAQLRPQTRNKLYVACTRARNRLYLVPQSMFKKL